MLNCPKLRTRRDIDATHETRIRSKFLQAVPKNLEVEIIFHEAPSKGDGSFDHTARMSAPKLRYLAETPLAVAASGKIVL